jgi:hypothetical protein
MGLPDTSPVPKKEMWSAVAANDSSSLLLVEHDLAEGDAQGSSIATWTNSQRNPPP